MKQICGEAATHLLEAQARADAAQQTFLPPQWPKNTYQQALLADAAYAVYSSQYRLRLLRNLRKGSPTC